MTTIRDCSPGKLEVGVIGIILTEERTRGAKGSTDEAYVSLSSLESHDVLTLFGLLPGHMIHRHMPFTLRSHCTISNRKALRKRCARQKVGQIGGALR